MDPLSNQASMTSGTRWASVPHSGQVSTTSSTYGRCGSSSDWSGPLSSDSSASDSTQVWWPSTHRQIGNGVPQYRLRESAQSMLLLSQSPYRPHLMVSGYQAVLSFSRSSASLIWVVRTYHDGCA